MNFEFPIGTIIKVDDLQLCIIGGASLMRNEKHISGYLCVVYPVGFTNVNSIVHVSQDMITDIVQIGYSTELSKKMSEFNMKLDDLTQKASSDDLTKIKSIFKEVLDKVGGIT